jgi:hypothetical protein
MNMSNVLKSEAQALERWEADGGATILSQLSPEAGDIIDAQRRVLECLGAAVVVEWNDLPTDIKRSIFQLAADHAAYESGPLKAHLARFLHHHKGAAAAR